MTLVHGVETKFDAEMVAMTRVPWSTLESVGDQSEQDFAIPFVLHPPLMFNFVQQLIAYFKVILKIPKYQVIHFMDV